MTEQEFMTALVEFTSTTVEELSMDDDLAAVGVDSIGIFEFQIKVEDVVGQDIEVNEDVRTVQDLYDCVLVAVEQSV